MLPSIPAPRLVTFAYRAYVALFFVYLAVPLIVVAVFAFNDSLYPSLPWKGFTLDWFFGASAPKIGLFHDRAILRGLVNSLLVAFATTAASVLVGTTTAFLFERYDFRFKGVCYMLMLAPLVIPGVILGISILAFSSQIANAADDAFGLELNALRPGLLLVALGQFSFIATIATLVISSRLRKFDRSLEEAALNLGASPFMAIVTVTLPYLAPALIGSALVAFLMSFENFNTTLMLVGSDAPLTITMFDRMKQGSTPVLNAVSVFLMLGSALLGLVSVMAQRGGKGTAE
ncbi:spermidine/putrescine transport system permease protein [Angulomicrobium tetraedrale]|uniref:Spermidine/putrescine transport system permease protein n=1 Tax=Ancylobacter tetraedralis TaxID=217068 RepID=A0A839ZCY5_9HYPH|nr:ABC transporter permease [Ancylobacter tetraedralis]MBB3772651.1 spermidine/putrescine transport system permease protein [Ancylobacter tetraedralis]